VIGAISSAAQVHVFPQPKDDFFADMLFAPKKLAKHSTFDCKAG
jgi:hypothetical protein